MPVNTFHADIRLFFEIFLIIVIFLQSILCCLLTRFAFYDQLTGLHNSNYLRFRLKFFSRRAKMVDYVCGLFIDLDDLKLINDTYSHAAGDMALKKVAEILKELFPHSIVIRRYKGDEFIVIFYTKSQKRTEAAQETAIRELSSIAINYAGNEFRASATVGKYCIQSSEDKAVEKILKKADEEMYASKRNKKQNMK